MHCFVHCYYSNFTNQQQQQVILLLLLFFAILFPTS